MQLITVATESSQGHAHYYPSCGALSGDSGLKMFRHTLKQRKFKLEAPGLLLSHLKIQKDFEHQGILSTCSEFLQYSSLHREILVSKGSLTASVRLFRQRNSCRSVSGLRERSSTLWTWMHNKQGHSEVLLWSVITFSNASNASSDGWLD